MGHARKRAQPKRLFAGVSVAVFLLASAGAIVSGSGRSQETDSQHYSPRLASTTSTGPEVGVVGDITWGTSFADVDRTVSSMAAAGVRWIRANANWAEGEPNAKGLIDEQWVTRTDYAVNAARSAGLNVLMPISDGVPYWASGDPGKYKDAFGSHWNKTWRPSNFGDYADFVRFVVGRYKNAGVHTYELWNEPNLARFWPSGPNAAAYKALLAATYPVVKLADPSATVVLGGLSKNDYNYLQQLYTAGARSYFDAVAVHPYTGSADPTWCWNQAGTTKLAVDAFCSIEEVRNTMVANGDSAKSLWLTEFGWSTSSGAYGVTEATQADYVTKAFTKLQSYPYVKAAFWYNFRNAWVDPGHYEANLGLLRSDYSAKPSYNAVRTYTGGATPPPADTQRPVLSAISVSNIERRSVVINWSTNENADSRVEYWVGTAAARTVSNTSLVRTRSITLAGLTRNTTYSYRVRSADAAGNATYSTVFKFTTRR